MEQTKRTKKMEVPLEQTPDDVEMEWFISQMSPVLVSPMAEAMITDEEKNIACNRHVFSNWRTLQARLLNELTDTSRPRELVISIYESSDGTEFWVVTDKKLRTGILLPEEFSGSLATGNKFAVN